MRLGPDQSDQVGLRGFLLLAATGLVGVGLAVHGYGHGAVIVAGGAGVSAPIAQATTPSAKATSPSPSAPSQKLGPLLSSTPYGPYAFRVYPGPETSQASLATAGFTVKVTPRANTIEVSVSASGSSQGAQTSTYPAGDHVYFIEASFGDDSGNVEYNFGDDGVVVTNAQGHVVA